MQPHASLISLRTSPVLNPVSLEEATVDIKTGQIQMRHAAGREQTLHSGLDAGLLCSWARLWRTRSGRLYRVSYFNYRSSVTWTINFRT